MKTRLLYSISLIALLSFMSTTVYAQFQGQIQMNLYSDDNGRMEVNPVNMFVTSDRIFFKGQEQMKFSDSFDASGLLIRNDMKDFIVLMGEDDALQVTKSEIEGLFDMFSMMSGEDSDVQYNGEEVDPNYRYTNKTRTILGYECTQMIIENDDSQSNGSYLSIWLTPNIDINWGMLAEPWKNLPQEMESTVNGMSRETIFKGKSFPMMVEAYDGKKGEMETVMEVTNINKSNIAKAMVQIPAGVNLVGISEFMWKMMMNSGSRKSN